MLNIIDQRQIADLRAQGEFQKADALLELTQTYLGQLIDLEKWGAEFNLDVDKFNAQIDMWKADFDLSVGEVLGEYQGVPTLENEKYQASLSQTEREYLASSGLAALAAGVRPSAAQQQAMGYTNAQIEAELAAYSMTSRSGSKTRTYTDNSPAAALTNGLAGLFADLYSAGLTEEAAVQHYLRDLGYTVTESEEYAGEYVQKLDEDALREFLYDSLGEEGKQFVSRVQRRNWKSGADGLTSGDKQVLENCLDDDRITMADLSIILTLFGN